MKYVVAQPWFLLVDLFFVSTGVILLEAYPQASGWPILVALLPCLARGAAGKPIFRRTPFDLPLAIFFLTGIIGAWAGYQAQHSWMKFYLLTAAILLYYSVAAQSIRSLWGLAGLLGFVSTFVAVIFLLFNNWNVNPAKVDIFNQLMLGWMKVRPSTPLVDLHLHEAAGIIAMTSPFLVAIAIKNWNRRHLLVKLGLIPAISLVIFTLLITTSRITWLALGGTFAVWGLWFVISVLTKHLHLDRRLVFSLCLILIGILLVGLFIRYNDQFVRLANLMPGPQEAADRIKLMHSALDLIGDYAYTGGGLDSFPGQFSEYIMVNPNYIIAHSHIMFLDAAFEQGILGALVIVWIFLGSVGRLASVRIKQNGLLLQLTILSSLAILLFHGLSDDIVYSTSYIPLLFLLPGMAIAISPSSTPLPVLKWRKNLSRAVSGLLLSTVFLLVLFFHQPLQAAWLANLGAVRMAQVELAQFPSGQWKENGEYLAALAPAEKLFKRALEINPSNRTANHRLGLIALHRQDFEGATHYLEIAYQLEPNHRGIRKNLAYSYVWDGKPELALPLLNQIPEAHSEMGTYAYWWREQGREDLAAYANSMVNLLDEAKNH